MDQAATPTPLLPLVSHDRIFIFQHMACLCSSFGGFWPLFKDLCPAFLSSPGTGAYIVYAEHKERSRQHAPNVSGEGSLLFIIYNGMSEQRWHRGVVRDVSCHCIKFYITNDCFHYSSPLTCFIYGGRKVVSFLIFFAPRHNMAETLTYKATSRSRVSCGHPFTCDIYLNQYFLVQMAHNVYFTTLLLS